MSGAGYEESLRVVFDCNVYVQAVANEQSLAAKAVDLLEAGAITLFVSEEDKTMQIIRRTKQCQ